MLQSEAEGEDDEGEGGGRAPSALQSNFIPTNDSYELCYPNLNHRGSKAVVLQLPGKNLDDLCRGK